MARELAGEILVDLDDDHHVLGVDRVLNLFLAVVDADFRKGGGAFEAADQLGRGEPPILIEHADGTWVTSIVAA